MKTTLVSAAFALLVVAANWHSTTSYERLYSHTRVTVDGPGLVVVCCLVALFLLARTLYSSFRLCLERGIRVPLSLRMIDLGPCLLLLPLLVRYSTTSTATSPDGILTTHEWGFGSPLSFYALVLTVLTIAAFQLSRGLSDFIRSAEKA